MNKGFVFPHSECNGLKITNENKFTNNDLNYQIFLILKRYPIWHQSIPSIGMKVLFLIIFYKFSSIINYFYLGPIHKIDDNSNNKYSFNTNRNSEIKSFFINKLGKYI